jgi:hypothetical protein
MIVLEIFRRNGDCTFYVVVKSRPSIQKNDGVGTWDYPSVRHKSILIFVKKKNGNFFWKFFLEILFGDFIWKFYLEILFGNFIWKFYLGILFGIFS